MIDWANTQRESRPSRPWAGQWWQEWDEHLHRYGIANEPGGFDDDLIGFVLARIAEEDRAAVVAARSRKFTWRFEHDSQEVTDVERDTDAVAVVEARQCGPHIAHWDPEQVLAWCQARRGIVARVIEAMHNSETLAGNEADAKVFFQYGVGSALQETLRWLAAPYQGHPDYHEEWRP